MTVQEVKAEMTNAMLQLYTDFLNAWAEENDGEHPYPDPLVFEEYADKPKLVETSWYTIVIWDVSDGDDGGPSTLVAYFDPEFVPNENQRLVALDAAFDTYITPIWNVTYMEGPDDSPKSSHWPKEQVEGR